MGLIGVTLLYGVLQIGKENKGMATTGLIMNIAKLFFVDNYACNYPG
jgi:hypothetical protein